MNYDLQMTQEQLGDPEKKSYWDNKLSYTAKFDMLDMHIIIKYVWRNVLEVHEVHEVQEIPNQIKKYILGEVIACR